MKRRRVGLARKAARKAAPDADEKRSRHFGPGTVTLLKIRKLQKSTGLPITEAPFNRLVRNITQEHMRNVRFQAGAAKALQHVSEAFIIEMFEEAQLAALHAKRVRIIPNDIHLAVRMESCDKNILPVYTPGKYSR